LSLALATFVAMGEGTLSLRPERLPPRTAHVVRGGIMQPSDLRRAATLCLRLHEVLGLTVWVADIAELEDQITRVGAPLQHRNLAVCSLAALDESEIHPTGRAPHFTLVLPSVDRSVPERLRSCFLLIPNPLVS
jgi:hypothetical protein